MDIGSLDKIGKISVDELQQLQLERFQSTLNRVYQNVPFYHNRFKELQLEPGEFQSLEDIVYLPFTTRKDLSDHYPYGMFAVPLRDILRIHTSVGSGVNPTVVGYTNRDLANWKEIVARCLIAAQVTPNDIIQVLFDYGLANWGRDFRDGAEAIESSIIPMTHLPAEKQLLVMRDYKSSVLVTTPSHALHLSLVLKEQSFGAKDLALRKCLLLGESMDENTRRDVEEAFGVKAWFSYGLSEVPGPGIAFECVQRQGLHISEDHFIVEIIDPETQKPVLPGEIGELVLTTITTKAFPLVRFRTGDLGRLLLERCSCGLNFKRLDLFAERADEIVVIRGVKIHPVQINTTIQKVFDGSTPAYVVFVTRDNFLEILEVWISVDESLFSDKIKSLEMTTGILKKELEGTLGVSVIVRLVEPPSLERYREHLGKIVQRSIQV